MQPQWLRLAYMAEFLIAVVAIFTVWSQVGGQGHLDLMPWYWKMFPSLALAFALVRMTAAFVERDKLVNSTVLGWLACAMTIIAAMAAVTYYYHLHEADEDSEGVTTSLPTFEARTR